MLTRILIFFSIAIISTSCNSLIEEESNKLSDEIIEITKDQLEKAREEIVDALKKELDVAGTEIISSLTDKTNVDLDGWKDDVISFLFKSITNIRAFVHNYRLEYNWKWDDPDQPRNSVFGGEAIFEVNKNLSFFFDYGILETVFQDDLGGFESEGEAIGAGFKVRQAFTNDGDIGTEVDLRVGKHYSREDEGYWKYKLEGKELDALFGFYWFPFNTPNISDDELSVSFHAGGLFKYVDGDFEYREYDQISKSWNEYPDKYDHQSINPYLGFTFLFPLDMEIEGRGYYVSDTNTVSYILSVGYRF